MADSVYRVTEVIGVSSESWEAAARNAVETAGKTVRDLRVAEGDLHAHALSAEPPGVAHQATHVLVRGDEPAQERRAHDTGRAGQQQHRVKRSGAPSAEMIAHASIYHPPEPPR